jgi:hypothetical protein
MSAWKVKQKPPADNFAHQKLTDNPQALAVAFAGFIHVDSVLCVLYHLNRFRHFLQSWDFEQHSAPATPYATVGGAGVKQSCAATSRAFGNNLHRQSPLRCLNNEIQDQA